MNMGFPQSAHSLNTANIQPLGLSSVFNPMNQQHSANLNNLNTLQLPLSASGMVNGMNGINGLVSGSPRLSDHSRKSGSSQAPPLPTFSPPVLSQAQIDEKQEAQRKKLQNLLPGMNRWQPAEPVLNLKRDSKRTETPTVKAPKLRRSPRRKKPVLPKLKAMDSKGNVIEPAVCPKVEKKEPAQSAAGSHSALTPNQEMQRDLYCPQCQKTFDTDRGYRQHMTKQHGVKLARGRNKERRFECDHPDCDRSFYQRSDLRRHQRVHLGVKPFKCSVCLKEFTQRGSLYRHIKSTHKDCKDHRELVVLQGTQTMPRQPRKKRAIRSQSGSVSPANLNDLQIPQHIRDIAANADLPPPLIPVSAAGPALPPMLPPAAAAGSNMMPTVVAQPP